MTSVKLPGINEHTARGDLSFADSDQALLNTKDKSDSAAHNKLVLKANGGAINGSIGNDVFHPQSNNLMMDDTT